MNILMQPECSAIKEKNILRLMLLVYFLQNKNKKKQDEHRWSVLISSFLSRTVIWFETE